MFKVYIVCSKLPSDVSMILLWLMTMALRNVETSEGTAKFDFLDVDAKITHSHQVKPKITYSHQVKPSQHIDRLITCIIYSTLTWLMVRFEIKKRKVVPAIHGNDQELWFWIKLTHNIKSNYRSLRYVHTIPDGFGAGTKTIPDRALFTHKNGEFWRDSLNGAKTRRRLKWRIAYWIGVDTIPNSRGSGV